jgi:N-methylhydantoinase A/oxoprolinase/acetone carboxylase beta subunit
VHARLLARAGDLIAADGLAGADATYRASADLRYVGQQFSITIELPIGAPAEQWERTFRQTYERTHGSVAGDPPVEFVNLRLTGVGPDIAWTGSAEATAPQPKRSARIVHRGVAMEATVCGRSALSADVLGPAVVSDAGATIYLPPGWTAVDGPFGTAVLTKLKDHS